jgi:hypothetical protein
MTTVLYALARAQPAALRRLLYVPVFRPFHSLLNLADGLGFCRRRISSAVRAASCSGVGGFFVLAYFFFGAIGCLVVAVCASAAIDAAIRPAASGTATMVLCMKSPRFGFAGPSVQAARQSNHRRLYSFRSCGLAVPALRQMTIFRGFLGRERCNGAFEGREIEAGGQSEVEGQDFN